MVPSTRRDIILHHLAAEMGCGPCGSAAHGGKIAPGGEPPGEFSPRSQGESSILLPFFGYCSKSAALAEQIQESIKRAGATVHNWEMDFRAGESILGEISTASAQCSCGLFLFSEDDRYADTADVVAPRDNVVFEAGYFMSTRGHDRCLIIRHGDAKMPADLGGTIYLQLQRGSDVSAIEPRLHRYLREQLQ